MTLGRVSIRAFALVVLCTATVSARPPQTTAFARRTTSRDDESILSAGRSLHLDVKVLAATGAMKVVTATVKLH